MKIKLSDWIAGKKLSNSEITFQVTKGYAIVMKNRANLNQIKIIFPHTKIKKNNPE